MEIRTIYLAGGCFWGTEHFMSMVKGVVDTEVGFANSIVPYPSYKQVCTGVTDAAETVRVEYDHQKVSLSALLKLYFMTIDPTSVDRQGHDVGTQYRTGIYYVDESDKLVIEKAIRELASEYDEPLAIEVLPLENFYPAEDYHQDYLYKNPEGYCHLDSALFEYVKSLQ